MIKRKRINPNILLFLAGFILFTASVAFAEQDQPEEIVKQYYSSLIYGNFEEAYNLLSMEDKDNVSMEEYTGLMSMLWNTGGMLIDMKVTFPDLYIYVEEHLFHAVPVTIKETPGRFDMEMEISFLDIYRMFFELPDVEPIINDPNQPFGILNEAAVRAVNTLYRESGPPMHVDVIPLSILEEDGEWKLFANIAHELLLMRSEELGTEAWSASFDGNLALARDLYLEALDLNPENERFRDALRGVEEKLREAEDKMNVQPEPYVLEFIEVWNVRIEKGMFPKIVFSMRNNGDRLVDDIKVRMAYLSPEGDLLEIEMGRIDRYDMPLYPGFDYEDNIWTPWYAPQKWDGEHFEFTILEAAGTPADETEKTEYSDEER